MPEGRVGCAKGYVSYNNNCITIKESQEIMKEELDRLKKNDKEYLEQVKRDLKRQDVLKAAEDALRDSEGGKRRKKRKTRRRKKSRKSRRRKGKKSRKSRRRRTRRTRKN